MKQVEKSARTTEEAISLALLELGVSREQVTVEIVEEPSKGFLGFGSREAIVRVRYEPPQDVLNVAELLHTAGTPARAQRAEEARPEPLAVRSVLPEQKRVASSAEPGESKPERVKALVQQICTAMGLNVQVTVGMEDDRLAVDVKGPNAGILIGHHGQTLDALQLLLNMAAAKIHDDGVRISLDVEGYRKRREETLIRLAISKADQVRHSGRKVLLEPMNAQERRIVHMALQDSPDVATESEGEDPFRRVVIVPK